MYTYGLGMRNVGKLRVYEGSRSIAKVYSQAGFSDSLKNAVQNRQKAKEADSADNENSTCCQQCSQTSQLARKLLQSVYLQGGLGSLNLYGLPLAGSGSLASYQGMVDLLKGSLFSGQ